MLEMYLGVFNEATGRGLEFYSDKYPAFIETCRHAKFISNIWKIISIDLKIIGEDMEIVNLAPN